jgi:hypothetical protein
MGVCDSASPPAHAVALAVRENEAKIPPSEDPRQMKGLCLLSLGKAFDSFHTIWTFWDIFIDLTRYRWWGRARLVNFINLGLFDEESQRGTFPSGTEKAS